MPPKAISNSSGGGRTIEKVAQDAVNQTSFGWFNLKIYIFGALACINIGFGLGNIGLIIPAAACDFQMTTIDKGRIAVSPIVGMMFGPYFWACVADMKGRKYSLKLSLILHGLSEMAASIISNYWGFLACKFFNGFTLGAQLALVFTYMAEFQPCKYRDRVLAWTELPWGLGLIMTAGLGWIIIPLDIRYQSGTFFFFNSWNLFLLICALPGPLIAAWLTLLPETPKYLAESQDVAKLIDLLCLMYHENTGNSREEYLNRLKKLENPEINELILRAKNQTSSPRQLSFRKKLGDFSRQTLEIIKPPYLKTTIFVCITAYCVTSAYFTMVFWLPEIFQRFAIFEEKFPGKSASVCTVSELLYSTNATQFQNVEDIFEDCSPNLNTEVFLDNVILGSACIPPALWLPFCVDRLGYKLHFMVATLISSALAFGLMLVESSIQNLILSCIFEAFSSISITIILCTLVELYPTHLRIIASAFATFVGRIGAVVGISLVGYLIDDYCIPLVTIVGAHLAVAGIVGFFIPIRKTKHEFEKEEENREKNREIALKNGV